MMVTVFCSSGGACWSAGFAPVRRRPRASRRLSRRRRLRMRDVYDRLAAERIVVEDGEAREGHQKQAEQHRQRLHCRKGSRNRRFRRTVFCPSGALRSSAVSAMDLSESTGPTIPRRGQAAAPRRPLPQRRAYRPRGTRSAVSKKGGPKAARSQKRSGGRAQLAALLLPGLSIGALSPVAGGAGLALMPCRRSSAIFSALSSLASGGT